VIRAVHSWSVVDPGPSVQLGRSSEMLDQLRHVQQPALPPSRHLTDAATAATLSATLYYLSGDFAIRLQESRAVAGKPRDAAVNFDRYRMCRQLFVSFNTFSGTESRLEVIQSHAFSHQTVPRV